MAHSPFETRLADGRLGALIWGREDASETWLALHGWLDNAATFSWLAPRLVEALDIRIVAIDFAGHGHSDWLPTGHDYPLWGYIHDVLDAMDSLSIERATLLAHSLGACVTCLLAAAMPERLTRGYLIDGIGMLTTRVADTTRQLRHGLLGVRRPRSTPPSYESLEAAARARVAGAVTPLSLEGAEVLVRRNLHEAGGRYSFRTDPRLLRPSQVRLTPEQAAAMLESIETPLELFQAEEGIIGGQLDAENVRARMGTLRTHHVPGGHHLHLEQDAVDGLAQAIIEAADSQLKCPDE
ncbi:alpha/beta fold hydrolase [Kushneria phosphatilytica]|uniref:Alpha/beta hydrolase n=1 Tax=Kushneria phosphatilytica TaxID=657387 RepID=A0A1S1NYV8_9GAMM|nr:alpha/beta hydrolase [Kushneria phosphatilytica]OHV12922.1 alpha/beta hydrolase [Kushneria phosphatilytica]QEL10787.1 alpha/beta hydrolase [Kushneria phosphatilytica]